MSYCQFCNKIYHLINGYYPPPCLFKSKNQLYQDPQFPRVFFVDILCQCGYKIGRQIFSAQNFIGWWELTLQNHSKQHEQVDKEQKNRLSIFKEFKQFLQCNLSKSITKVYEEQVQSKISLLMTQKLIRKANQSLSKSK